MTDSVGLAKLRAELNGIIEDVSLVSVKTVYVFVILTLLPILVVFEALLIKDISNVADDLVFVISDGFNLVTPVLPDIRILS